MPGEGSSLRLDEACKANSLPSLGLIAAHRESLSSPTAGLTCQCIFESTSWEGGFWCWG